MNKRSILLYLGIISILLIAVIGYYAFSFSTLDQTPVSFDGTRALADVQTQVDLGPRIPGTEGHAQVRAWIQSQLETAGWIVEVHESERLGHPIYNIIAKQ